VVPFVVLVKKVPPRPGGGTEMWDTPQTNQVHLSHDLPCSDSCACVPAAFAQAA